jgi:UDPglucose 6-dehydrogenase
MESLTGLARENRVDLKVLNAARSVNVDLANRLMQKVAAAIDSVQNKDVGILGLAFKPNTNSVAGSASLQLAQNLLAGGARVRTYDPVAMPDARLQLNGMVKYCESAYGVAEGVDALIVATGWPEFRTLDFARIRHLVKRPIIIDTKNLLDSSRLRAMGFQYMGVGRP